MPQDLALLEMATHSRVFSGRVAEDEIRGLQKSVGQAYHLKVYFATEQYIRG